MCRTKDASNFPAVALVSVCFNDRERLPRFLESLGQLEYPNFSFVLVDNDSHDDSVQIVRSQYPEAEIVRLNENRGTTGGYNVGIQRVLAQGADYVMTLAIDVRLHHQCLSKLVEACEAEAQIGAVGPLLFYSNEPGKVQMYGGSMDVRTSMGRHDYNGVTDVASLATMHDAQYLDGGTMLLRASVLRLIGGFDEELFMYLEDNDLSIRIQKAGYRTVAVRDAWAWHYHRQNKGAMLLPYELFYITRNRFYFSAKHGFQRPAQGLLSWEVAKRLFSYLRHGKVALARAYIAGILFGKRGRMGKQGWVE
jgi:hypothetical protein